MLFLSKTVSKIIQFLKKIFSPHWTSYLTGQCPTPSLDKVARQFHTIKKHNIIKCKKIINVNTEPFFKKNLGKLLIPAAVNLTILCLTTLTWDRVQTYVWHLRACPLGRLCDTKGKALCSHPLLRFPNLKAFMVTAQPAPSANTTCNIITYPGGYSQKSTPPWSLT